MSPLIPNIMKGIPASIIKRIYFSAAVKNVALAVGVVSCLSGCNPSSPVDQSNASGDSPEFKYGTKVSFGQGGGSERLMESGWSKTEEKFTWSEGTAAVLRLRVPATNDSVTLKMRLSGLIKEPELPFQPVDVEVNGEKIANWQVGITALFIAAIPHDITKTGGELTITLKIPKATSPKALGVNADPRVLGICCLDFELSKG